MIKGIAYIKNKGDAKSYIEDLFDKKLPNTIPSKLISYTQSPDVWLYNLMSAIGFPFSVVTEPFHVDRVYRDSYYTYFSNQHFQLSRFCKRISFFNIELNDDLFYNKSSIKHIVESFLGACVIRPLTNGAIGHTLLSPRIFSRYNHYTAYERLTDFKINVRGLSLCVKCFPYSMQDTETTSCSGITLINILEYFSNRYADYKFINPSDIVRICKDSSCERVLPTRGMKYTHLSRVFTKFGFSPRLYYDQALPNGVYSLKKIWHYYIESGIPVALGLGNRLQNTKSGHSIIGIGHSEEKRPYDDVTLTHRNGVNFIDTADLYDKYIIMDDNQLPFALRSFERISEYDFQPNTLAVPLSKRMFMEATDAFDIATSIITDSSLGICRISAMHRSYKNLGSVKDPYVLRLFLTSARSYKEHKLKSKGDNKKMKKIYTNLPLPRFVWICEIYTKAGFESNKTIGEIILDATSSSKSGINSMVSLRYLNRIAIRSPEQSINSLINMFSNKELKYWASMSGFNGNLTKVSM